MLKMLDRWDMDRGYGSGPEDDSQWRVQTEDGRTGTILSGDTAWSTSYCECCGPEAVGASCVVRWDDDGSETDHCLEDGYWMEGVPLYRLD